MLDSGLNTRIMQSIEASNTAPKFYRKGSSRKFKMHLTNLAKCVECESCSTATQQDRSFTIRCTIELARKGSKPNT